MNREKHEKRNFWLLLVLAVLAGLGFLIWGQYNTASTTSTWASSGGTPPSS